MDIIGITVEANAHLNNAAIWVPSLFGFLGLITYRLSDEARDKQLVDDWAASAEEIN